MTWISYRQSVNSKYYHVISQWLLAKAKNCPIRGTWMLNIAQTCFTLMSWFSGCDQSFTWSNLTFKNIVVHTMLYLSKILNQIKSKISSQLKMEESMTQETAWFRTYVIRTDPSLQIRLLTVSCPQTLTSDGEKFEQWCFVWRGSRSPGRCSCYGYLL